MQRLPLPAPSRRAKAAAARAQTRLSRVDVRVMVRVCAIGIASLLSRRLPLLQRPAFDALAKDAHRLHPLTGLVIQQGEPLLLRLRLLQRDDNFAFEARALQAP
eukprot:567350-Prymnesium_polylepis.3